MTLEQVRKIALALPETTEEPHFDRTSFRVRGKIFVTARVGDEHVHVFVGDAHREPALALHPDCMEKLVWGGKVVGLRIRIDAVRDDDLQDLIMAAWSGKAPRSLLRQIAD